MKKSIVAFLLAFTVSIIGYSQVTFSGKVLDENNVPLPGASVVVKGHHAAHSPSPQLFEPFTRQ